jgi:hypothetical protein
MEQADTFAVGEQYIYHAGIQTKRYERCTAFLQFSSSRNNNTKPVDVRVLPKGK